MIERTVRVNSESHRVLEQGTGEPIGFLAGLGGLNDWTPFLERLSARRRVIAPSLPGFPGGGSGHKTLDSLPDWIAALLDLLEAAGLEGCDLIGHSIGGMLAAEAAAFSRATVRRLVLLAPLGLCLPEEPASDVWARLPSELPALFSVKPAEFEAARLTPLAGLGAAEITEWQIVQTRAGEAAARLLWPIGDLGLGKRLHRITCPVLIVRGEQDRVVPASHVARFAQRIAGTTRVCALPDAGHALDFDAPDALAALIASPGL